jgi:hypothetical protein
MGNFLGDWEEEKGKLMLGKFYDKLPTGGCIIVYQAFVDDQRSKESDINIVASLACSMTNKGDFQSFSLY